MFIRTENFQTFIRLYPVTSAILALQLAIWILFLFPFTAVQMWSDLLIGFNWGIANGEWWRFVTPIFIHAGFGHLLFNSMSIFLFAPGLERMLGKLKFLIVYIGAGVIGNIGTYFIEPLEYMHVGASGAIFGLFGVYLYIVLFRKEPDGERQFPNHRHHPRHFGFDDVCKPKYQYDGAHLRSAGRTRLGSAIVKQKSERLLTVHSFFI